MLSFELVFRRQIFELILTAKVARGTITIITGASGSGKTTLLRLLAGLETPTSGTITDGDQVYFNPKVNLPTQRRDIGFVFQDYALFPHLSVEKNLRFALHDRQADNIIHELLETFELKPLKDRKPPTLSGGQQQRVALARALVRQPKYLLLDEPLSALDLELRRRLSGYLKSLVDTTNMAIVMVSHDREEIAALADRVIELADGQVVYEGAPKLATDAEAATILKVEIDQDGKRILVVELKNKDLESGLTIGNSVLITRGTDRSFRARPPRRDDRSLSGLT